MCDRRAGCTTLDYIDAIHWDYKSPLSRVLGSRVPYQNHRFDIRKKNRQLGNVTKLTNSTTRGQMLWEARDFHSFLASLVNQQPLAC